MARPTNAFLANRKLEELRSTNETYSKFRPEWAFSLSAYEGGPDFFNGNLFTHARETKADFNRRLERVHNINYCDVLVDFFTNFIFSESIDRESNNPFYNEFISNVNRAGSNVDKFMMSVCDDMQIYGISYTLVDAPRVNNIISKADAKDINPYWISVSPFEVIDWSLDEFGSYVYLKRQQFIERFSNGRQKIERFTQYTPEIITVTDVDISDKSKPLIISEQIFPNELGTIPIVVTKYKDSRKYPDLGISFLLDFAYNNRQIMNLSSLLDEFLYKQAFNILTVQTDISNSGQPLVVGTSNTLEYPREADRPQYIAPDPDCAQFIQSEMSRIKREMFNRAAQDTINELFNGEGRSGFSQAQSFSRTVPFISTRADKLEASENKLMKLTMQFRDEEWDGKIRYKDRYELTSLTDALTQLLIICQDLSMPSETFVKQELKRVAREFDSKLPSAIMEDVIDEIEKMDFKEWQSKFKSKTTSPGEQQKPKQTGTMMELSMESNQQSSTNKVV